jgi:hypothetical protein
MLVKRNKLIIISKLVNPYRNIAEVYIYHNYSKQYKLTLNKEFELGNVSWEEFETKIRSKGLLGLKGFISV